MDNLKELLQSNPDDLNKELKRAFRPLTPHIKIDGKELDALTILVNLTGKTADQKDLLDRTRCKEKLRDEKWLGLCLNTIEYIQSHNLKFPDIRSGGVIRASTLGSLPEHLLSSSKLPQLFWAYSHDSKYVNKSAFLTSEFCWEGVISCLAIFLQDESHILWTKLLELGCYKKTQKAVLKKLRSFDAQKIDVALTGNYLTQLSLPNDEGSYVSFSPVASQSMQSHCYQTLSQNYQYSVTTRFSRITSMGVLPMTCGGAFRMFRSVPNFSQTPHCNLSNNERWLTKESIQSLKDYTHLNKRLITDNQKQAYRKSATDNVRKMIRAWLSHQNSEIDADTLTEYLNYDLSQMRTTKRFAYLPKLTRLFHSLLKQELKDPLFEPNNDSCNSKTGAFLLLPNIRVSGASALSSSMTVGIPSLTAFYGYVHSFECHLKESNSAAEIESFAVCIHQFHLDKRGLTKEFVEKANGTISPPSTHDDWQCDFTFSLVLKFSHQPNIPDDSIIKVLPKRLARGTAKISIADFHNIQSFDSLTSAIEHVPIQKGKWLSLYKSHLNSFDDLISSVREKRWLTPSCVGFHLLEKPSEKRGSLRGYKHAFSEPIIGLINPIVFGNKTDSNEILWRYKYHTDYISIQTEA
ncbi:type I-F CRISPR-associated protein Csy2 [Vibrio parahaemolyticus]|nr:type I-F CRISPR-associated protein Csy2 [Vibrio parahaemolyticus]MDF5101799.1 type I-F CRISPR-associated protein Csy2 [Vibrio parahaemolyticus]MDF5258557.1 type I-F CRISPR-associated protein Csy2 [Vibrio parahaemolyticus]